MKSEVKGQFEYNGIYVLQNPNIFGVFEKLFQKKKPKRIIEIGTEYGGLTLMLKDILKKICQNNFLIRTYDIKEPKTLLNNPNFEKTIEVVVKNLFDSNPFSLKKESLIELKEFVSNDSCNIFLCDGGNKAKEFNVISDILNVGDIIMAHDYAKNEKYFEENIKNKYWNWFEIQESDIEKCCEKNNLNPYMQNDFEKVAWVCKIKNE